MSKEKQEKDFDSTDGLIHVLLGIWVIACILCRIIAPRWVESVALVLGMFFGILVVTSGIVCSLPHQPDLPPDHLRKKEKQS